ncbi:unnamed protein product [Amoebophrya sp. A25]|nr:unnamed protein product [Amoebophrya sp. A25]|eukprot:GSA25T00016159001.1
MTINHAHFQHTFSAFAAEPLNTYDPPGVLRRDALPAADLDPDALKPFVKLFNKHVKRAVADRPASGLSASTASDSTKSKVSGSSNWNSTSYGGKEAPQPPALLPALDVGTILQNGGADALETLQHARLLGQLDRSMQVNLGSEILWKTARATAVQVLEDMPGLTRAERKELLTKLEEYDKSTREVERTFDAEENGLHDKDEDGQEFLGRKSDHLKRHHRTSDFASSTRAKKTRTVPSAPSDGKVDFTSQRRLSRELDLALEDDVHEFATAKDFGLEEKGVDPPTSMDAGSHQTVHLAAASGDRKKIHVTKFLEIAPPAERGSSSSSRKRPTQFIPAEQLEWRRHAPISSSRSMNKNNNNQYQTSFADSTGQPPTTDDDQVVTTSQESPSTFRWMVDKVGHKFSRIFGWHKNAAAPADQHSETPDEGATADSTDGEAGTKEQDSIDVALQDAVKEIIPQKYPPVRVRMTAERSMLEDQLARPELMPKARKTQKQVEEEADKEQAKEAKEEEDAGEDNGAAEKKESSTSQRPPATTAEALALPAVERFEKLGLITSEIKSMRDPGDFPDPLSLDVMLKALNVGDRLIPRHTTVQSACEEYAAARGKIRSFAATCRALGNTFIRKTDPLLLAESGLRGCGRTVLDTNGLCEHPTDRLSCDGVEEMARKMDDEVLEVCNGEVTLDASGTANAPLLPAPIDTFLEAARTEQDFAVAAA